MRAVLRCRADEGQWTKFAQLRNVLRELIEDIIVLEVQGAETLQSLKEAFQTSKEGLLSIPWRGTSVSLPAGCFLEELYEDSGSPLQAFAEHTKASKARFLQKITTASAAGV